jgi:hypothetical protein
MVGNPQILNSFNDYIDLKIAEHHKVMEQSNDTVIMYRAQGAIAMLKKLKSLRDEVNGIK